MKNKILLLILTLILAFTLSGCINVVSSCVEDDICTASERISGCNDCRDINDDVPPLNDNPADGYYLEFNKPLDTIVDGEVVRLEIVGTVGENTMVLTVNGESSQVGRGDTVVNGYLITVSEIFINDVPLLSVSANIQISSWGQDDSSADEYFLELSEERDVIVDGKVVRLELTGANDEAMTLTVNDVSSVIGVGDTVVNGYLITVSEIFITDVPLLSVSANIKISYWGQDNSDLEAVPVHGIYDDVRVIGELGDDTYYHTVDVTKLPQILSGGNVLDVTNRRIPYTNDIFFLTPYVKFGDPDDLPTPELFADFFYNDDFSDRYFQVIFQAPISVHGAFHNSLASDQTVNFFGTDYAFRHVDSTSSLNLVSAQQPIYLTLEDGKFTFSDRDGDSNTIEIVSGNADADSVGLLINGVRRTATMGELFTFGDVAIYVSDVLFSTVPVESVSINVYVDVDVVSIPTSARSTDCSVNTAVSARVDLNGDEVDGILVCVQTLSTDSWKDISTFRFGYDPKDTNQDYLLVGEEMTVPLFNALKFGFSGPSIPLESEDRDFVKFYASGNDWKVTFTNILGEEYDLEILSKTGSQLSWAEDFATSAYGNGLGFSNLSEDDIFIASNSSTRVSKIYQVLDVDRDENEVTFRNLKAGGSDITVPLGEELDNTGMFVGGLYLSQDSLSSGVFELHDALGYRYNNIPNVIYTQYGSMDFGYIENFNNRDVSIHVSDNSSGSQTMRFNLSVSYWDELTIHGEAGELVNLVSDENSDFAYGITNYGTYIVEETDGANEFIEFYIPEEKVTYSMYIAGQGYHVQTPTVSDGNNYPSPSAGQSLYSDSENYWKNHAPISITRTFISSTQNDELVIMNNGGRSIVIKNISLDGRHIGGAYGGGFNSSQFKVLSPGQSFTYTRQGGWFNIYEDFLSTPCVAGDIWSVTVGVTYTNVPPVYTYHLFEDENKLEGICAN
ncbi:MAG: hypothetical protein ACI8Y7_000802 [Candidatus Woesearchaeota archaeon]|jgi:hypothetical protein